MALNLTLKPFERIVVNGCMIRNGGRKSTITVETRADIIRETDILKPGTPATPVNSAYFLIQAALIQPEKREALSKAAQKQLAALATVFAGDNRVQVFEAANNVSRGDHFAALRNLRPLMAREAEVLGAAGAGDAGGPPADWAAPVAEPLPQVRRA